MGAVVAWLVGVAAFVGFPPEQRHVTGARVLPAAVPPAVVLAKSPYAGVTCRVPTSGVCDGIGLAVWTRRPARAVSATVAGRSFRLDDREWSAPPKRGLRRMFAGFLTHAGLRELEVRPYDEIAPWLGEHPVRLRVRLVITGADGSRQATVVPVDLMPGWG